MPRLEKITYDAGRHALADQETLVSGIRQRIGTLLAANALVASLLGSATIRAQGLKALSWIALVALVLGLCASAVLLAPWQLKFAVDARELYDELYEQASAEVETGTLGLACGGRVWLSGAARGKRGQGSANVVAVGRGRDPDDRPDRWLPRCRAVQGTASARRGVFTLWFTPRLFALFHLGPGNKKP